MPRRAADGLQEQLHDNHQVVGIQEMRLPPYPPHDEEGRAHHSFHCRNVFLLSLLSELSFKELYFLKPLTVFGIVSI